MQHHQDSHSKRNPYFRIGRRKQRKPHLLWILMMLHLRLPTDNNHQRLDRFPSHQEPNSINNRTKTSTRTVNKEEELNKVTLIGFRALKLGNKQRRKQEDSGEKQLREIRTWIYTLKWRKLVGRCKITWKGTEVASGENLICNWLLNRERSYQYSTSPLHCTSVRNRGLKLKRFFHMKYLKISSIFIHKPQNLFSPKYYEEAIKETFPGGDG